jgi:serine-type D-Ala-D-Ala carboxypeptidase/endopeptidase (penicillin-binding protein 4)
LKKIFISALLIFGFCSTVFATTSSFLQKNITSIINRHVKHGFVGVAVADKRTGQIIYSNNGSRYFRPASNMKVFTAAAAFYQLGPNYHFHTTIAINPKELQGGVLHGDLYIKFVGDPSFTIHDLTNMLAMLKQHGVKQIDGNIVFDTNQFLPPNYAPGWTINDMNWSYSAPITAVTLNENAVTISFLANHKIGSPIKVMPGPYAKFISIISGIRAVSQQEANGQCQLNTRMDQQNRFYLGGCWPALKDNSVLRFAVTNPTLWVENITRHLLTSDGVAVQGHFVTGNMPSGLTTVADHASQPLSALIGHMLKVSDNFYADCLLKTLGAVYYHRGDFQNGVRAMQAILAAKAHLTFDHHVMFDGSGQSYYNFISPQQMVKLLYQVSQASFFKAFYNDLAISGIDGTIRYRMSGKGLLGKVHAKTGTFQAGGSALSGYVQAANGHTLIFSILTNNIPNVHVARQAEDAIVGILRRI